MSTSPVTENIQYSFLEKPCFLLNGNWLLKLFNKIKGVGEGTENSKLKKRKFYCDNRLKDFQTLQGFALRMENYII